MAHVYFVSCGHFFWDFCAVLTSVSQCLRGILPFFANCKAGRPTGQNHRRYQMVWSACPRPLLNTDFRCPSARTSHFFFSIEATQRSRDMWSIPAVRDFVCLFYFIFLIVLLLFSSLTVLLPNKHGIFLWLHRCIHVTYICIHRA